jgi:hypothetical protein
MKNFDFSSDRPWYDKRASIRQVIIEDGITSIVRYAFDEFKNLTSITIPSSVTSIGYQAFCDCDNLRSITIPNSVKNIGMYAFSWCGKLKDIYFGGSEEQWKAIYPSSEKDLPNVTVHYNSN